jgi:hypothetical protein
VQWSFHMALLKFPRLLSVEINHALAGLWIFVVRVRNIVGFSEEAPR